MSRLSQRWRLLGGLALTLVMLSSIVTPAQASAAGLVAPGFVSSGFSSAPGAPTDVAGLAGNVRVTVSWSAPASDGGAPISAYTVTASPDGATCTWSSGPLSCVVLGLANGTPYTFTVVATNLVGDSEPSVASSSATPHVSVPDPPANPSGTPGDTQVTVAWDAPANDGGSAITSYAVTGSPGNQACGWSTGPLRCVVVGLTNGTSYTFTVTATNSIGTSEPSAVPVGVTPRTIPTAPVAVSAVGTAAGAVITWGEPLSDGGAPITQYTVTSTPGGRTCTWTTGLLSCAVTGLSNGTAYTFTVVATNDAGDGPPSAASSSVIPQHSKIAFDSARDKFEIWVAAPPPPGQGWAPIQLTSNTAYDDQPVWSPDGSKLAFTSNRDGLLAIYVMAASGGSQTQLTDGTANAEQPSWSPDGTKIAFTSDRSGGHAIFTINANGTGLTQVTVSGGDDQWPSWSPDGTKIAFSSGITGAAHISRINANGTGRAQLTTAPANDAQPDWSPDGTKIAFTSDRATDHAEIYVMNADGTGQTQVTDSLATKSYPTWTTDSAHIYYVSNGQLDHAGAGVFRIDADGSNPTLLFTNANGVVAARPSRDGTQFTFSTQNFSDFQIYLMNDDGTGQTRLTTNTSSDQLPALSPDDTRVAFERASPPNYVNAIWVMNSDGSGQTNLTPGGEVVPAVEYSKPAWSPDGTMIVYIRRVNDGTGTGNLYTMNADGTGKILLTNNGSGINDLSPAWSPDGTKIAFTRHNENVGPGAELFTINPDGSDETQITNPGSWTPNIDRNRAAWSPDGTRLAFYHQDFDDTSMYAASIHIINADGTNDSEVPGTHFANAAVFSPDGTKLALDDYSRGGVHGIVTIDLAQPPSSSLRASSETSAALSTDPVPTLLTLLTARGDQGADWGTAVLPGEPVAVAASPGNAKAFVSWNTPTRNPASGVSHYVVTASPGGETCSWSSGPLACQVKNLTNGTPYTFTVRASNVSGLGPASTPSNSVTPSATVGTFTALSPSRILDTRFNVGLSGPFGPQQTRALTVVGVGGVPASGVDAVILNVTATAPTANGWLTLFPANASLPTASNLNFVAGQTVPNLVVVKVGHAGANEGKVSINNTGGNPAAGSVQVIADVVGYYGDGSAAEGARFVGVTPTRILDTRSNLGLTGIFGPRQTRDLTVGGKAGVPIDADAVVMNVTATGPTKNGWLTLFPAGQGLPTASNLNFTAGQTVPNLVVVKLGTAAKVSINNSGTSAGAGSVHVIADVVGYYKNGVGTLLTPVAPQRILDTRNGTGGVVGPISGQGTITVDPQTAAGLPAVGSYSAVIVNVTVTAPTKNGWLTVFPSGSTLPTASNLNFVAGQTVPNLVMVKVGADGKFKINNTGGNPNAGTVHVIADIVGYYT